MSQEEYIYLSDLLNALSLEELQRLRETVDKRLESALGQGARAISSNPIVNDVLERSPSPDIDNLSSSFDDQVRNALKRIGIDSTGVPSGLSPVWDPIIRFPGARPQIVLPRRGGGFPRSPRGPFNPAGSGYHDTNPNNPFKDYNKSTGTGYHDTNPNNPFKDYNRSTDDRFGDSGVVDPIEQFRELILGGRIVTSDDLKFVSEKLESIEDELRTIRTEK